jgi:hypothetical protein
MKNAIKNFLDTPDKRIAFLISLISSILASALLAPLVIVFLDKQ